MRKYEKVLSEIDADLTDYERGWLDGVRLYASMRDGTYYVGTTGRTLAEAVELFLRARGKWPRSGPQIVNTDAS